MRTTKSILLAAVFACVSAHALAAGSSFSGTYRVNGKDAKLAHITAMAGGCFHDGVGILLTEKEVQAKPDENFGDISFKAQMSSFGDAIAVQICARHDTWEVDHTNLNHSAVKPAAGTWDKQLKVEGMTVANGEYSGHLVSIKDAKLYDDGQPLEVNITFHAKP